VPFVSPGDASAAPVAGATAETDSRMTTAPAPLLATLPRRRPRRRAPAARTTVVPLEGDLEARPRELEAELGARLCRDTTLVLDLRGATFLGAGAARLLLDLRSQAAAAGVRLVLWRPEGQPFRTLRIVRFDRVFELRPASWRPPQSRDWTVAHPERWVDVRAG
jgi:anti-anti-sigma factor